MNHERAHDLLLELSYGELETDDAREVERHVTGCPECSAEWERLCGTRRALAGLGAGPRSDARRAAILDAARTAVAAGPRAAAPTTRRVRRSTLWALGATAAVATIVGGVTLKLSDGRPLDHVATVAPQESPPSSPQAPLAARDEAVRSPEPAAPPPRASAGAAALPRERRREAAKARPSDARPERQLRDVPVPSSDEALAAAPPAAASPRGAPAAMMREQAATRDGAEPRGRDDAAR
ncbi:MAG TPA: zf-HC2 domain-containing protein, partial [Anaeromyxobacteraceae bacterium]|nr:zf-HC2 domain-containing protein [Anaeromyxobacteraceae bacterium]